MLGHILQNVLKFHSNAMGSKRSKSKSRRAVFKKRKFNGNRFTTGTEADINSPTEKQPRENEANIDEVDFSTTPKRQKLACEDDALMCRETIIIC